MREYLSTGDVQSSHNHLTDLFSLQSGVHCSDQVIRLLLLRLFLLLLLLTCSFFSFRDLFDHRKPGIDMIYEIRETKSWLQITQIYSFRCFVSADVICRFRNLLVCCFASVCEEPSTSPEGWSCGKLFTKQFAAQRGNFQLIIISLLTN